MMRDIRGWDSRRKYIHCQAECGFPRGDNRCRPCEYWLPNNEATVPSVRVEMLNAMKHRQEEQ